MFVACNQAGSLLSACIGRTPMTTTTNTDHLETRHETARELLTSLAEVKGWIRDAGRSVYPTYTYNVLASLALVDRLGAARVSVLAEAARVDVSVVSRQLRAPDPNDGRASLVSLSEEGQRVLAKGRARMVALMEERLSGWSTAELADV